MSNEEILKELKEICDNLGYFPKQKEMKQMGKYALLYQIQKSNYKLYEFADQLGYDIKHKFCGYWTEERLVEKLKEICKIENGWPDEDLWVNKYHNIYPLMYRKQVDRKNTGVEYYRAIVEVKKISPSEELECCFCKNKFYPTIGTNWKRQVFCKDSCRTNYFRTKQNKKNAIRIKQPKICPVCSVEFIPKSTTKQRYCKRSCLVSFRKKLVKSLERCMKAFGTEKQNSTYKAVGYTPNDLLGHLKNHWNWENVQGKEWQLDHVFPIKAFIDHGISDPKLINCLDNLQPVLKEYNLSKGGKYDIKLFEIWLENKLKSS